jgi:predicted DNA-binding protein (MmcQ/YjbR family)
MAEKKPTPARAAKPRSATPATKQGAASKQKSSVASPPKPQPHAAPTNTSPAANFCRSLPGVTEDIKWGDHLMFSVGPPGREKIFAGFDLEDTGLIGFKCDDADFDCLTDIDGIIPAPYAARFGWVKLTRRGVLPQAELHALLHKSWRLVAAKLPAAARKPLGL